MKVPEWEEDNFWRYRWDDTDLETYVAFTTTYTTIDGKLDCDVQMTPTDRAIQRVYTVVSVNVGGNEYQVVHKYNHWENGTWATVVTSSTDPSFNVGDPIDDGTYVRTSSGTATEYYNIDNLNFIKSSGNSASFTDADDDGDNANSNDLSWTLTEDGTNNVTISSGVNADWKPTWDTEDLKVGDSWTDQSTRTYNYTTDLQWGGVFSISETNSGTYDYTYDLTYECVEVVPKTVNNIDYEEAFKINRTGSFDWDWSDGTASDSGTTTLGPYEKWVAEEAGWAIEYNNTLRLMGYNYEIHTIELRPNTDNGLALEDEFYNTHYWTQYGQPSTWIFDTNASWLSWDSSSQNISGTPDNGDVSSYWVRLKVIDNLGFTDEHNYTLVVINSLPEIETSDVNYIMEDAEYRVDYNSSDDGQGTITWHMETDADDWLSINSSTGILKGTPLNDHIGQYYVNVSVDDGNDGRNWSNFTLTVNNTNDPPIIIGEDNTVAIENEIYFCDYDVTDVDITNTLFTWNMTTNASWLSIDSVGNVSGVPVNDDVGSYWVNITVKDSAEAEDSRNFTLIVENMNDAPIIITEDNLTAYEDLVYSVQYEALDVDLNASLEWNMVTNASGWLSFIQESGFLNGIPSNDDVGTYWINISVFDCSMALDYHNFTLTVQNINDPPTINGTPKWAFEDEEYIHNFEVIDIDVGDTVFIWSMETDASWLSIVESTGYLTGTPDNDDVGEYYVNISVKDAAGAFDHLNFTMRVTNANDNPTWEKIPGDSSIDMGTSYEFDVEATDVDAGDRIGYCLQLKTGTIIPINDTGYFNWTPDNPGTYTLVVTASDGHGDYIVHEFTIEVKKVKTDKPEKGMGDLLMPLLLMIIVIIIIIAVVMATKKKGKSEALPDDDGPDEEADHSSEE